MRLTKYDREAFIKAVMDDVPSTNYNEIAEKEIRHAFYRAAPVAAQGLYDDPILRRKYLSTHFVALPGVLQNFSAYLYDEAALNAMRPRLRELDGLATGQKEARAQLEGQVTAAINACTTLKMALERLPEFEKYLPADRDGKTNRSMPVIANLIAGLTEAGWPKDKPLKSGTEGV